jgi:anaerobic selenocysteine-containing dehydrogenase
MAARQQVHAYCPLCTSTCGCIATVEDGVLTQIDPDPAHPTGSALCGKGRASVDLVTKPNRLLSPLRRTAPKDARDPGWERISWEEALDLVGERLRGVALESGPEAVTFGCSTPAGTALADAFRWIAGLAFAYGTPNFLSGSTEICNWHRDDAYAFTVGMPQPSPDIERTGCLVLWGHNPRAAWLARMTRAIEAKKDGAALIVVDPRKEGLAGRADVWLRVRPGADGALALGLLRELLRNRTYDDDFVRRWTTAPALVRTDTRRLLRWGEVDGDGAPDLVGLDPAGGPAPLAPGQGDFDPAASARVRLADGNEVECLTAFEHLRRRVEPWTPERTQEVAWVEADAVRSAAALMVERRPLSLATWTGVGQGTNATQTTRAIACLHALIGDLDAPGGNVAFAGVPVAPVPWFQSLDPDQQAKALGRSERPLGPARQGAVGSLQLWRSILDGEPYRTRAFVCFGVNPIMTHADPHLARRALEQLEFHVHVDQALTPTAQYADIVLPASTPWERESVQVGFRIDDEAQRTVQWRPALVEPRGESRSDLEIVCGIGERLGLSDQLGGRTPRELHEKLLEPCGLTVAALQRASGHRVVVEGATVHRKHAQPGDDGSPRGFATPSGRVELYLEAFLDIRADPVPAFEEPAVSPIRQSGPERTEFPLVLTSAKLPQYCHSQHRGLAKLRRAVREPGVALHPDAAAARGLEAGQWVRVRSPRGQIRARLQLDDSLDARVACGQFGWWESCPELGEPGYPPLATDGSSANFGLLVGGDELDPISGSQPLRQYVCQVEAEP